MFSHQVFSIKERLMDLFSVCVARLVETICPEWELSPATVHTPLNRKRGRGGRKWLFGFQKYTSQWMNSGKSLCHWSSEHLTSRQRSPQHQTRSLITPSSYVRWQIENNMHAATPAWNRRDSFGFLTRGGFYSLIALVLKLRWDCSPANDRRT